MMKLNLKGRMGYQKVSHDKDDIFHKTEDNHDFYENGPGNDNGGRDNRNNQGNKDEDPKRPSMMVFVVITIIGLLLISYFMRLTTSSSSKEISYNEFITMVEQGEIESVQLDSDRIIIIPKKAGNPQTTISLFGSGYQYYTALIESPETVTQRLLEEGIEVKGSVEDYSSLLISILLTYVLPIVLMWVLLSFLFRKISKSGGMGLGVGKSNAKIYGEKDTGVTFKDVAGEEEAKESLVEIVDFLHNPEKYSKIGAKLPKGALLVGPPGTGKTLLAKAVAGEAGVPFFSLAGSDFIELYVGVGASRVRDLFKEAEKNAPCIIFIDEIDAIGRSRDSKYGGGNEEREQTLNQLLSEMDGFDAKKGIIILAATNRPEILDKALLRPGRFDRRVIVEEPDLKGRIDILKVHAKNVLMDESVNFEEVALATVGSVGADLANMINEAAILAVKAGRQFVNQKDLLDAVELVSMGKEKKDKLMSKKEREIVSYHEVGHALISALQKNSEPVQKITIIPRTSGALGYVMSYPEEEKFTQTELELRAELVSLLGGRAAEEIVFDTVTTGAANDIEKATRIARAMVTRFGMSKKFGLIGLESVESEYLDRRTVMNCADETAADIDAEVMKILKESYKEAKKLLKENRDILDKIAAYLIKQETITGREFMEIYCREKGIPVPKKDKAEESLDKLHEQQRQDAMKQQMANQAYIAQQNFSAPTRNGNPGNGTSFHGNGIPNGQFTGNAMPGQRNGAPGNPYNGNGTAGQVSGAPNGQFTGNAAPGQRNGMPGGDSRFYGPDSQNRAGKPGNGQYQNGPYYENIPGSYQSNENVNTNQVGFGQPFNMAANNQNPVGFGLSNMSGENPNVGTVNTGNRTMPTGQIMNQGTTVRLSSSDSDLAPWERAADQDYRQKEEKPDPRKILDGAESKLNAEQKSEAEMNIHADDSTKTVQKPEDKKSDTKPDFAEQLKDRIYREVPDDEDE